MTISVKTLKQLPYGVENFVSLREKGYYYVDKTPYLKTVFTDSSSVLLFTRPRRFGKTLLMDMFDSFLSITPYGSDKRMRQEKIFEGLKITGDKDFTDKYMGQFPVIFLSLKKVYGETFEEAYDALARIIVVLFSKFQILLNSEKLSEYEKSNFRNYLDRKILCNLNSIGYVKESLGFLSKCLRNYYEKKVILLIDEYDVPLVKAAEKGYHTQMVTLIKPVLRSYENSS